MSMVRPASRVSKVLMTGPLVPFADADALELKQRCYTPLTSVVQLRRHTAAMRLLLAGNDVTVIALWLGHEQLSTTNIYLHADMSHKQRAIDRTRPLHSKQG